MNSLNALIIIYFSFIITNLEKINLSRKTLEFRMNTLYRSKHRMTFFELVDLCAVHPI